MNDRTIRPSDQLSGVRYEIRGPLARRALELEAAGQSIIKLNIGNPGSFGFRMPEAMQRAISENLLRSEAYCHQKGITPARDAIVAQQRARGAINVGVEEVFVGNGVSELIMLALRALLNEGDEVLVPSPDYPLWTAAVTLNGGVAVHYPCPPERGFLPDADELRRKITPRTRALVVITPNNPTGAVYPRELLQSMVDIAEEHGLVVFSDEIYDNILYDGAQHTPLASLVKNTLCGTFGGLSKVYRACGLRVGWLSFSGTVPAAKEYLLGVDLLASLRLCANVPGQWAVQTALEGAQCIEDLTRAGGRLYETRRAVLDATAQSRYLSVMPPRGAMYGFVKVNTERLPGFADQRFALDLLEKKHVLVAPGGSFNVPYRDHFRITLLPEAGTMREVFGRIEELLDEQASAPRSVRPAASAPVDAIAT